MNVHATQSLLSSLRFEVEMVDYFTLSLYVVKTYEFNKIKLQTIRAFTYTHLRSHGWWAKGTLVRQ